MPIFTSLSPNTEKNDIFLALKLIFSPAKWKKGNTIEKLETEFSNYLGVKHAISFNSGRSGLLAILKSLNLAEKSEILIQGFTCNAVVNPILWSELKPVYVDIDETLNINPKELEKKAGKKSRAVLVQHTFGHPAKLDEILGICEKKDLILIEDCAHSLGAVYKGKKVGTFGQAAFFSFGRDKIISSVYGGVVVTNDDDLAQKIRNFQKNLDFPSNLWIVQQLLHPVLTNFLIIPFYDFFEFGRWILLFFQKTKILSKAVHKKEKEGEMPDYIPQKMPNALAILAYKQFKKLGKFIFHQKGLAGFYDDNLAGLDFELPEINPERVYMRYPLLVENKETDEILKKARKQKIFLDDGWRKAVVTPVDTNQEKMEYRKGTCPKAEKVAENILNLPTHINISKKRAQKIINFLKDFYYGD